MKAIYAIQVFSRSVGRSLIFYKAPLRECNKDDWLSLFVNTHIYIYELRNGITGARMCTEDPKKTGFLGIICNIVAVERIFQEHVENGSLYFLQTYKLSQDFLEHFFGLGNPFSIIKVCPWYLY